MWGWWSTIDDLKKKRELEKLIAQMERMKKEEHLRFVRPFEKQQIYHLCKKRNAWLLGGNRTGKTSSGALKAVLYALGDSARKYMKDWPEELRLKYEPLIMRFGGKPTRGWIGSVSFEVQRDVTQKQLLGDSETGQPGILPLTEIKRKKNGDLMITYRSTGVIDLVHLKNGSVIGFKSYDQGREKFQGTSQHWVWLDEEPPKEVYTECLMRTMDTVGDIFGTMTPLQGLTWVYEDVYLNETKPISKQDAEVFCMTMEWKDNPYLSLEEQKRLEASMDAAELEARKYGRFIMPGKCSFDISAINEALPKCYAGERGNLVWKGIDSVEWVPDDQGDYEVWFHPNKSYEYLISADIAEGLEHGDFDAVLVWNRNRNRVDAVYHGHIDPDVLADYMIKLATYYNKPMLAPESNNHGLTTISHLKIDYPDIYKTKIYDKHADEEREKLGWHTTPKTRPLLVDAIKRAVRERTFECYWRRFWDEAMNFIRWPNGKEAARAGYWDDAVVAAGIAVHVHSTTPLMGDMPSPDTGGRGGGIKAGWQKDSNGNEIFIHPSKVEDMRRREWGEEEW